MYYVITESSSMKIKGIELIDMIHNYGMSIYNGLYDDNNILLSGDLKTKAGTSLGYVFRA